MRMVREVAVTSLPELQRYPFSCDARKLSMHVTTHTHDVVQSSLAVLTGSTCVPPYSSATKRFFRAPVRRRMAIWLYALVFVRYLTYEPCSAQQ